jgi:hypothetical protein
MGNIRSSEDTELFKDQVGHKAPPTTPGTAFPLTEDTTEPIVKKATTVQIGNDTVTLSEKEAFEIVLDKFKETSYSRSLKETAAVKLAVPRLILSNYFNFDWEKGQKIRLVITEVDNQNSREFLSSFMHVFGQAPAFGLYHTALSIGPLVLDWNASSLCIPRYNIGNIIFSIDLCDIKTEDDMFYAVDDICERVAFWNVNMKYSKENNCQKFVDDLCKELKLTIPRYGEYLSKIRKTGRCEPIFTIGLELAHILGVEESEIEFTTHKELDDFINKVIADGMYFKTEAGKMDEMLLTAYDKAYWYKHKKDSSSDIYIPHKCPFEM